MQKADWILESEALFTGITAGPQPGCVAVGGDRILAVGSESEVQDYRGPETKVYRFGNQLIMPGFHDFHLHVVLGSLCLETVDLTWAASEEEAARMVKDFADTRPDDPWVLGWGWHHTFWDSKQLPHRSSLDRLIPDRPVFLFNAELHGAWLNTKGLEVAGITKETPDPPFGRIEREADGSPSGFLYETAMGLAKAALTLSQSRRRNLIKGFLKECARQGVTSVHDMFPLPGLDLGDLETYGELERAGELTSRIHFLSALDGDFEWPQYLRRTYRSDVLQFSGLKQFLDGVPVTYTAYLLSPYSDRPDISGRPLFPPETVKEWTVAADKEGFRVRFHACGDGAVRLALDCFELARVKNGRRDARHTIEHIEVIHPADLPRFAELEVIASMQPEHLRATPFFEDNPYRIRYAGEREQYLWAIRSLKEHGARVALGSDFPVVTINPFIEIYRAVSRLHDDGQPVGGWNPEQKLSVNEVLTDYTAGSAFAAFRENDLGTLEPGKRADLVVLDRNLFDIDPTEIRDTRVILTMMNGRIVYEG